MLNNFNNMIKSYLFQDAETDDEKSKIINAYNTNEFYLRFIQNIAIDNKVNATKQRNNCYLVYGTIRNLINFFNNLKVDKSFMKSPDDFKIYSPIFSFGELHANLKFDQYFPMDNYLKTCVPFTHETENFTGKITEGRWFNFSDNMQRTIKNIKPADVKNLLKSMFSKSDKFLDECNMYIEFQINTDNLSNQLWDEMTEYAKTPEEMNEIFNDNDIDFDYSQLNVKNIDDENRVKSSLKDIKGKK